MHANVPAAMGALQIRAYGNQYLLAHRADVAMAALYDPFAPGHNSCLACQTCPLSCAGKGQWKWNICWPMVLIVLAWFVVTIIYIVVRATKSLSLGHLVAYGVWVLVVEGLGASTLLLYAFHLCLRPRKHTPPTVRVNECLLPEAWLILRLGCCRPVQLHLCLSL